MKVPINGTKVPRKRAQVHLKRSKVRAKRRKVHMDGPVGQELDRLRNAPVSVLVARYEELMGRDSSSQLAGSPAETPTETGSQKQAESGGVITAYI